MVKFSIYLNRRVFVMFSCALLSLYCLFLNSYSFDATGRLCFVIVGNFTYIISITDTFRQPFRKAGDTALEDHGGNVSTGVKSYLSFMITEPIPGHGAIQFFRA